jgi:hypothetical protein
MKAVVSKNTSAVDMTNPAHIIAVVLILILGFVFCVMLAGGGFFTAK